MLPSGHLAKHGYTVRWGFFEGVCPGSDRLPFEQSTDAIEDAVQHVRSDIIATESEIARYEDLSDPVNDGSAVWVQVYTDEYRWVKARLHDFTTDSTTYAPSQISRCSFTTVEEFRNRRGEQKPITKSIEAYSDAWKMHDIREWARYLNRKFAAQLVKRNESRRQWLVWQQERVAKWAPAPLTPR
jgi:hypothetical protein